MDQSRETADQSDLLKAGMKMSSAMTQVVHVRSKETAGGTWWDGLHLPTFCIQNSVLIHSAFCHFKPV